MRKWEVQKLGEPTEALSLVSSEPPESEAGEVVIEVRAAALNFFDVLLCQGNYQEKPDLPFTPGAEVAGEIVAAGGESGFEAGQRVVALASMPRGGFAERVVTEAANAFPIPEQVPFESAAALPITYGTAHFGLHRRAALREGETVLVHAGSGGVGSAAIQLAKAVGARVIATAGGPEKVEVCRGLGADLALDYLETDFVDPVKEATGGRGADVIFDPVGGDVFDRSRRCVAFEGRILIVGFTSGRIADAPTNHALVKNYSVLGLHWGLYSKFMPKLVWETNKRLIDLHAEGSIDPLIYRTVPFEEVPEALELLGDRKTWGKIVTRPVT
jgi:NADPH2:quinone reductase